MKFGEIADLFEGVGAKVLRAVEVDRLRSNQHEFQGVRSLRNVLGEASEPETFDADFVWIDDEEEVVRVASFCTWSDVRRNNPNRAAEYHLYYGADASEVVFKAKAGDLMLIAKTSKQTLLVVICPGDSIVANQMLWVFGLDDVRTSDDAAVFHTGDGHELSLAAATILERIGIEVEASEPSGLDQLIDRFGMKFPPTHEFSKFAREHSNQVDPVADPDNALIEWMEFEEQLFRYLERLIVAQRLEKGFEGADGKADVEEFVKYSLSVQNRRKSRAGFAFGHHIEAVLVANNVPHTREARTEGKKRPDFLFPSQQSYHAESFDSELLTVLGAKTSCKDRWRQVLSEAARVERKHLITLQPGITLDQTTEMRAEKLQLVVPTPIHSSYSDDQRPWLFSLRDFLELVVEKARIAAL